MILFSATVFLSAFLLFQVQPIVAKMILPWFGGSSSVWSACMVFFQGALLVGYAYVHWLNEKVAPHRQPIVHAILLLASLLMLPVEADPSWKGTTLEHPSAAVIVVLAGAVGVPYLLLSTTGPLMQVWYARASASAGIQARPYRLYALSNLASMRALLTYPVLVEPAMSVGAQADVWSGGYALFVLACLGSAWLGWKASGSALIAGAPGTSVDDDSPRPSAAECLLWIGLSATASILLLALTRHLTQDVAPVPFLWVLPLAIYLLTFILCFDAPRYYVRPLFLAALPVAFVALDQAKGVHTGVPMLIAVFCVSLFVICMVCHGELVRRKPPVRHLTLFYLMLSLGGVLGGMLVGLVAPAVFNAYFELPIGLFMCAALVAIVLWKESSRGLRAALAIGLVLYGARLSFVSLEYVQGYRQVVRNFYSQTRVEDIDDPALGPARLMLHGRINHGEQYLSEKLRRVPSAYFCERSGIGRAFLSLPQDRPLKLGVLGLGIGVLAAYGRDGDEMRIYEINEQVLELAQREFSYLSDSKAKIVPILGDGRLMLEREPVQKFDLLVMDAFSGDSVPTHLVTLEAIRTYLGQMNEGGLLAFNITNRFLDLRPVMAAAAARLGRVAVAYETIPTGQEDICRRSHWVLMLTPQQAADLPERLKVFRPIAERPGFEPWTDTYSNLLKILKPRE
ncbi:MAG: fused MFS/spermidine synthase [Burkholderiales bacterium]|nr:fused MFS/spermidine synthase [Burkholderiales bacterium]